MKPSQLKHKINILEKRLTDDGYQSKMEYTFQKQIYAFVDVLSMRTTMLAHQTKMQISHRIIIRNNAYPDLTNEHRVTFGKDVFDIDLIDKITNPGYWIIIANKLIEDDYFNE